MKRKLFFLCLPPFSTHNDNTRKDIKNSQIQRIKDKPAVLGDNLAVKGNCISSNEEFNKNQPYSEGGSYNKLKNLYKIAITQKTRTAIPIHTPRFLATMSVSFIAIFIK